MARFSTLLQPLAVVVVVLVAVSASRGEQQEQKRSGSGVSDLITDLPGLNFKPTFEQYSGYLNATDGRNLFYWLVESQSDPSKDPVVLWLQGGPGCSGLGGLSTELGPFHVNPDGRTLYENVFSWNKFTNLLFIESPSGVGFSYSSPRNDSTNDDLTAHYNFEALRDFFYNKFPQYQDRDFYVTGESYGGVYVPTLAKVLIDGVAAQQFPDIFRGIAIGNGILSDKQQFNSLINLLYYHGITGPDEWSAMVEACCSKGTSDQCDFYSQRFHGSDCSRLISQYLTHQHVNDEYNMYQDCYSNRDGDDATATTRRDPLDVFNPSRRFFKPKARSFAKSLPPGTKDMAHQLNYDSTDSNLGFQCWADEETYFNQLEVKKALHVAESIWHQEWSDCSAIPYKRTYYDMSETFNYIIQNSKIRILIYNGDVDLVCNFLGDQWFVEREVVPENKLKVLKERGPWRYRGQVAGFVKYFERLDSLTVKGSGHFVPEDRAGPALQMLFNFIRNTENYSKATGIDVTPKPLVQ